jgi:[acyl-carrier-protein] S-malonyltransferase
MRSLIFPGQGVQRRGMGAGLFEEFDDLTRLADDVMGFSIEKLCVDDPDDRLRDTRYAQPAVFVVNALQARRVAGDGPPPAFYAGHSLGEFNALVEAGVIDLATGLLLVKRRAELMAEVTGGGMAAVTGLPRERVTQALRAAGLALVHVAGHNSDQQVTVAGDRAELSLAARALRSAGASRVVPVAVSGPFHTPLMARAARTFARVVREVPFADGHTPVMSSVSGERFDPARAEKLLSTQIVAPVEWVQVVRNLRAAGAGEFTEVNGRTLTSFIEKIR